MPSPDNAILLQGFEWNSSDDGKHYQRLKKVLDPLTACGVNNIWLPPGCKASSPQGNGYDIYDLYDLGEFDQKGAIRTKWGTKDDLLALSHAARDCGVGLYWDAVLNHKAGADKKERVHAVECDQDDRTKVVSEPYEILGWLGFEFPGRGDRYSKQKYHWYHFSGTDYNAENEKKAIYKLQGEGKGWSESVDDEQGNADYMMFADVDYGHPEVEADVKHWGAWVVNEIGLSGFRLDAVQHFSQRFTKEWVDCVRHESNREVFMVGEFWSGDVKVLCEWLDAMDGKFSLFDSPLLNNFSSLSQTESGDLRKVFDNTLVQAQPTNAITVVSNHDTQPGQTMETKIEPFFKTIAYALILLRDSGYPCVFWGDLYGTQGEDPVGPACDGKLASLMMARKYYAYGDQEEYLDEPNLIGLVRRGTLERPAGLACVISNAKEGTIRMAVGEMHAGQVWTDLLGNREEEVTIGEDGFAEFYCAAISVSVWVRNDAAFRDQFPIDFDINLDV